MERRTHARIARKLLSHVPVTYSGNAHGTGTLYDLSTGGCKVETGNTPPLGASLTLRLAVSPDTDPLTIDAAMVDNKIYVVEFNGGNAYEITLPLP